MKNKSILSTIITSKLWLFLFACICVQIRIDAKDYIFKDVTIDEGLSSNKIFCFLEDSLGRIWIGTDNGLNQYDGTTVTTFFSNKEDTNAIIHNTVNTLENDFNSSAIWVGTSVGLCKFNLHTQTASVLPKSVDPDKIMQSVNIQDLAFDKNGDLWIVTVNNIFKLDSTLTNITQHPNKYLKLSRYSSVYISPTNEVYVGGLSGVYKYNQHSMLFDFIESTSNLSQVKKIFEDSDGDLWVGTAYDGAYLFKNGNLNGKPQHFSTSNNTLLTNLVWDIEEYKRGCIFLVNKEAGIAIYDKNNDSFEYLKANPQNIYNIEDKAITTLKKDSHGNLWVGSFTSGVCYLDKYKKPFIHYTQGRGNSNLFNDNVRAFFEDSEGYIWVGIKQNGGLSRFDPKTKTFIHYHYDRSNPKALQGENVTCINEIDKRYLLVGTFLKGLHILDRKTGIFTQFMPNPNQAKSISSHYIITIDRYDENTFIIGNGEGADFFNVKQKTFTPFFRELSARACFIENKDSIWIGTLNGIYLLSANGRIWHRYTHENYRKKNPYSIKSDFIVAISSDSNGQIWVGSGLNGLFRLSKNRKTFIEIKSIIKKSTNRLKAMVIDNNDNIWFSTNEGLLVYYHEKNTYDYFTKYNGLQSNQFEPYAGLKLSDGKLLFGGRNGFNMFHPDSIRKNPTYLPVVFNDLKVFNKRITPGDETGILKKHISFTKALSLNHEQSMLSFEFSAIGFSSTEDNNYAYIMEGIEEEWNYVGNIRTATYAKLPPGNYTFKVKAANSDGLWNENPASIAIKISPPWWRRLWFYICLAIFLVGVTWGLVYLRIRQLRNQQKKLKAKVKERTLELSEINTLLEDQASVLDESNKELSKLNATKDKLFSIIAHDLRNPISSIMGITDILNKNYEDFEDSRRRQLIASVAASMKSTFQLLENLLNWTRSQSQSIKLNIQEFEPRNEIDKINNLLENAFAEKGLKLENQVPSDLKLLSDPNLFEVIFRNLITNAAKFSSQGVIEVLFEDKNETVCFKVKDYGVGMEQSQIDEIFSDQFSNSTAGTNGEVGTGLGLSVCKDFIHILNGKLSIESEVGKGTTFKVCMPKSNN